MKIQKKKIWVSIFCLIAIEQVIKVVINNNFLDRKLDIWPPFLYFQPVFNRQYSWFNSMLQLGISRWIHIAIVVIMIIFIYLFYQYLNEQLITNKTIDVMFVFIFSGAICSLIDKIFWDGSLDYILVNGFFTFDLKDVYLNIFNGLLLLSWLLGQKVFKQIEDRSITDGFAKFILRKLQTKL